MQESDTAADGPDRRLGAVIGRAFDAYRSLAELGETVTDEWQYVNDLLAVHGADLRALAATEPSRLLPASAAAAVDVAIEEIRLITDPHRAIDWLSTFPQIVRIAVGSTASEP